MDPTDYSKEYPWAYTQNEWGYTTGPYNFPVSGKKDFMGFHIPDTYSDVHIQPLKEKEDRTRITRRNLHSPEKPEDDFDLLTEDISPANYFKWLGTQPDRRDTFENRWKFYLAVRDKPKLQVKKRDYIQVPVRPGINRFVDKQTGKIY